MKPLFSKANLSETSVPDVSASRLSERSERLASRRELICNLRDAVVNVSAHTYLNPEGVIIRHGNGFFVKRHFILCPASLALAPFGNFVKHAREPAFPDLPTKDRHPNKYIRASKILVTISNLNGQGKSYVYQAAVVGIDGAANIAVLRILLGTFDNHPFLEWGKSRNSVPGDDVFVIGELGNDSQAGNSVALGNIANNRYAHPSGKIPGELLLLSNMLANNNSGMPVVGLDGKLLGMIVSSNLALSEFFLRRPIKAIISPEPDPHLQLVVDPITDYYVFSKGWLGISGYMVSGDDYYVSVKDEVRHVNEGVTEISPTFSREIVGYRVVRHITNGVTNEFPAIFYAPLLEVLEIGDIITQINGCPLGNRKGQISPSLVMWRIKPEDMVKINYRKQAENFNGEHEYKVRANHYPPVLDYPFYAYDSGKYDKFITLI